MNILSSIITSLVLFSLASYAQIPPLSQEEREAYSTHIISGLVIGMKRSLVERNTTMKDFNYDVTIAVTQSEKGDERSPKINFSFWKAAERPDGWCGHGGQHGIFKLYEEIRVYLRQDEAGNYTLIEPNGFDVL